MKTILVTILSLSLLLCFNFQASSQDIWGMTKYGGTYEKGVIFKMEENASSREVVFSFETVRSPEGGMTEYKEGVFYGMSAAGGKDNYGVIYQFDAATGGFTKVLDFNGEENGKDGAGKMIYALDEKFYGMTVNGGLYDKGIIFEFDPVTHEFIKLMDFDGSNTGSEPLGNLIQASDGKLYGMTSMGGEYDAGVIFSYDYDANEFSRLFDFNGDESGENPMGELTEFSDGVFYGMTRWGGNNGHGVIFSFMPAEQDYETLFSFKGEVTGRNPHGSLIKASNGKLYGLTPLGGSYNMGVLFEYNAGTGKFENKYEFTGGVYSGMNPYGSLVEAANGKLYGATDPYYNYGDALFEYDPVTDAYNIVSGPEVYPREIRSYLKSLTIASNGNLYYGYTGIMNDVKNVNYLYEYNPSNDKYENYFTYSGIATGDFPHGSLLQAANGLLYGVTYTGGKYDDGTIFRFDPVDYTFEKILNFEGNTIGSRPNAGLVQGNNLKLYGTTTKGGAFDQGVLFEVDATTGECIKLFDFNETNGKLPEGPLVIAANGKLYGMTTLGGEYNEGVLFELDPGNGAFIKVLDFEGEDTGRQPFPNSLIADSKGNVYGITGKGGMYDNGLLFEYSTESGKYTKVIEFDEDNSNVIPSNLAPGNNNAFYGYSEKSSSVFIFNPDDKSFQTTELTFDESYIHTLSGKLLHASNGKLYGMDGGYIWFRATDFPGSIFEIDLEEGSASLVLEFQEVSGSNPVNTSLIQLKNPDAPVVQCKNASLFLDENGYLVLDPADIDNGSSGEGIELTLSKSDFSCEDIGENNVVLTATDGNGNAASCTAVVTVADAIAPVAVCRDIEIFLDASGNAVIDVADVDNGSSDACGIESTTLDVTSFTFENIGENTVEMAVTDNNGNASVCSAVVTVIDSIAPQVVCNDIEVYLDASGIVRIEAADIDNGSYDASGIESMTLNITSFSCEDVGENTVELTVTDKNGNTSSCRAVVTVADNLAPQITCISTLNRVLEPYQELFYLEDGTWDAVAADNCFVESLEYVLNGESGNSGSSLAGLSLEAGVHEIEWLAADEAGSVSSCVTTVFIEKRPTTTQIIKDEIDLEQGVIHIEALLLDDLLVQGIEGKSLAVAANDTSVTAVTDENGLATIFLPIEEGSTGIYSLTAWFDGDAAYSESKAESEIETGSSDIMASAVKIYPNPFTERLYFEFTAMESTDARIDLFDATGRLVQNIFNQPVAAGRYYRIEYNPGRESSNIILYCMKIGSSVLNGKLVYGR